MTSSLEGVVIFEVFYSMKVFNIFSLNLMVARSFQVLVVDIKSFPKNALVSLETRLKVLALAIFTKLNWKRNSRGVFRIRRSQRITSKNAGHYVSNSLFCDKMFSN